MDAKLVTIKEDFLRLQVLVTSGKVAPQKHGQCIVIIYTTHAFCRSTQSDQHENMANCLSVKNCPRVDRFLLVLAEKLWFGRGVDNTRACLAHPNGFKLVKSFKSPPCPIIP